jgi:hypothetical protein
VKAIAAKLLEVSAADIHLEAGHARVSGTDRGCRWPMSRTSGTASRSCFRRTSILRASRRPAGYKAKVDTGTFSYACHAAKVSVDTETGHVEILDYVVVEDGGTLGEPDDRRRPDLRRRRAGNRHGAVRRRCRSTNRASRWRRRSPTTCCRAPRSARRSGSTTSRRPSPYTRFGQKGIGEGGAIAPPAAIANAVNDALAALGVEITESPLTAAADRRGARQGRQMKACAFEYERARDVSDAVRLLSSEGAKVAAGMQSLGPMLNLRVVQPSLLVDIRRLEELRTIREEGDTLALGACVTHAEIEDGRVPGPTGALLQESRVEDRVPRGAQSRHIGGSLAHADPAADWPSALALLGGIAIVAGPNGRREIPLDRFVTGLFSTDLASGEIVVSLRLKKLAGQRPFRLVEVLPQGRRIRAGDRRRARGPGNAASRGR